MKRVHHFHEYAEFEEFSKKHNVINFEQVKDWNRRFGSITAQHHGYVVMRDTTTKECQALHYLIVKQPHTTRIIIGVWYGWALLYVDRILSKINAQNFGHRFNAATFFCEVDRQPENMTPSSVVMTNKFGKEWANKRPSCVLDMCERNIFPNELDEWLAQAGQSHGLVTIPYYLYLNFDYEMVLAKHGYNAQRYMFDYTLN